MINVIVTMNIKENCMDDFLRLARELAAKVKQEEGCIAYEHTLDTESPISSQEPLQQNRVTLIEKWESREALEAHMVAPHMKELVPKLTSLRESSNVRATRPIG